MRDDIPAEPSTKPLPMRLEITTSFAEIGRPSVIAACVIRNEGTSAEMERLIPSSEYSREHPSMRL